MRRRHEQGEEIFIGLNSADELVIMNVERHRQQLDELARAGVHLEASPALEAQIDSTGRVKLPEDIRRFLNGSSPIDSPNR